MNQSNSPFGTEAISLKEKEKHVEDELKVKSWRHAAPAVANLNAQEPKVKGRPSSAMH